MSLLFFFQKFLQSLHSAGNLSSDSFGNPFQDLFGIFFDMPFINFLEDSNGISIESSSKITEIYSGPLLAVLINISTAIYFCYIERLTNYRRNLNKIVKEILKGITE